MNKQHRPDLQNSRPQTCTGDFLQDATHTSHRSEAVEHRSTYRALAN